MVTIITAIILFASLLLVFVVYVQNPKGGGLSSDFGAAHQLGGVQKTNDFIDKATWSLAALVGVLSIVLTVQTMSPKPKEVKVDQTEQGQNGQPSNQQGGQQQGGQQQQ